MMNTVFAIVVLGVLGAVFGLVLAIASKVFAVEKDPREEAVLRELRRLRLSRLRRLRCCHRGRRGSRKRLPPRWC